METVPRLRDTLRIERSADGEFRVLSREGAELFRLTDPGFFLLQQMDGVSSPDEVLERYEQRFEEPFPADELEGWIEQLGGAGVLVSDARASRILAYLKAEGVEFRRPTVDRRDAEERSGLPRRDDGSNVAPWFDYAVFLLNDGMLDKSLDVFERMAEARPDDVRLQEIVLHLRFLAASEGLPELGADRRDVSWAAFDAALSEMLRQGHCPRCGASFEIETGGANRCWACGSSFTAWVLAQADPERRGK
jgi:hypothetical protein